MSTITTKDGTEIFYKDWGTGQPIVFHHGWPLSADDWDAQMMFFLAKGFRVIAHDRRGHGRSTQTATGNEMDTYAADVAALAAHLDLSNAIHVGHSTGGGEVTRYVARHGKGRVAKAVLIGAGAADHGEVGEESGRHTHRSLRRLPRRAGRQSRATVRRHSVGSVLRVQPARAPRSRRA
jgi:pimeloyl-ACP methyl ester carboxylesterase